MRELRNDRAHVAWDIETTGFEWDNEITVSGFWFPSGHTTLLLNASTARRCDPELEAELESLQPGLSVEVQVCETESDLLQSMRQTMFDRFDTDRNRLIAFNADSWQGGFDLPFLRTRCLAQSIPWVFEDVHFADLWQPVKKRVNTTCTVHGTSVDVNSLTGSHALLFDTDSLAGLDDIDADYPPYRDHPYDPFGDSGNAVYAYDAGDFLPVLQHNLADVHRTWELGELVRQYVSGKDITTKKL
jgi:hypothetical protein